MVVSVALDHFGWLGLPHRSMDLQRLMGVVQLIGGVALIRR
jgi:bacterial/archaeal transporter family-2 protein